MRRVIKITEAQLREAEGDAFKYLDTSDDSHPFNGQSTITAQGKIDGEENAEPIFTDRIAKQHTPQAWARYRMYGSINKPAHTEPKSFNLETLDEGVEIKSSKTSLQGDENQDGIDDMYQNVASMGQGEGVETLSNGDPMDNLCVIPNGVDRLTNGLIDSINSHHLNPKQIAMVLDKIQEAFPEIGENSEFVKDLLRQQIDHNSVKDFN